MLAVFSRRPWRRNECVTNEPQDVCGEATYNPEAYRVFSHDVTEAILVSQNNETAVMLVSQTRLSPGVGVELFSYANAFICTNKFTWMLATPVKTLY